MFWVNQDSAIRISCNKFLFKCDKIQTRNVNNTLLIDHLQQVGYFNSTYIEFHMYQCSYKIKIHITHITFQQRRKFLGGLLPNSTLFIIECWFLSSRPPLVEIRGDNNDSSVVFINCKFMNNVNSDSLIVTIK